jgi:hypothetical protein
MIKNETTMTEATTYNGWANYETWNVALWLQNDVNLYYLCREMDNYVDTIDILNDEGMVATPDGVRYDDPKVNVIEINSKVFDF